MVTEIRITGLCEERRAAERRGNLLVYGKDEVLTNMLALCHSRPVSVYGVNSGGNPVLPEGKDAGLLTLDSGSGAGMTFSSFMVPLASGMNDCFVPIIVTCKDDFQAMFADFRS